MARLWYLVLLGGLSCSPQKFQGLVVLRVNLASDVNSRCFKAEVQGFQNSGLFLQSSPRSNSFKVAIVKPDLKGPDRIRIQVRGYSDESCMQLSSVKEESPSQEFSFEYTAEVSERSLLVSRFNSSTDAGIDAGFGDGGDVDAGKPDAGLDAGKPDAGPVVDGGPLRDAGVDAGRPVETVCNDDLDNDQDGSSDCEDSDCPTGTPCSFFCHQGGTCQGGLCVGETDSCLALVCQAPVVCQKTVCVGSQIVCPAPTECEGPAVCTEPTGCASTKLSGTLCSVGVCQNGVCVRPAFFDFGVHYFDGGILAGIDAGVDWVVTNNESINTDAPGDFSELTSSLIDLADGQRARLVVVNSFEVKPGVTLTAQGPYPLIVAARNTVVVDGEVLVNSTSVLLSKAGAGARSKTDCGLSAGADGVESDEGWTGAGGGALLLDGGSGGDFGASQGGIGGLRIISPQQRLAGGCPGGGTRVSDPTSGRGGNGGGALYLIAGVELTVAGTVSASGAGGEAGNLFGFRGGGGGGSGGMVVVQSKSVSVTGFVSANGGGGGQGSPFMLAGGDGNTETGAAAPGGGMKNVCASGGTGGANAPAGAQPGVDGCMGRPAFNGGGGGGGAAGILIVHSEMKSCTARQARFSPNRLRGANCP
jgi:hypothetical protein